MKKQLLALAVALAAGSSFAQTSGVVITEWMYQGGVGEFVEFTNLGPSAVDLTGWSYDDESRLAGTFPLSAFGLVAPGESVIITETNASTFRADWGLSAEVKVFGPYTNNLGNGDEINLYDSASQLVDRLTYGSNPRTQNTSGHATSADALGANNVSLWVLSSVGDIEGSWRSVSGSVGSPGQTSFAAAVPEPGTYALMMFGLGLLGWAARHRAD